MRLCYPFIRRESRNTATRLHHSKSPTLDSRRDYNTHLSAIFFFSLFPCVLHIANRNGDSHISDEASSASP